MNKGYYKHYKGGTYDVIGFATHTETNELLVLYKAVDGTTVWARPQWIFEQQVEVDGMLVPRFQFLE